MKIRSLHELDIITAHGVIFCPSPMLLLFSLPLNLNLYFSPVKSKFDHISNGVLCIGAA